MKQELMEKIDLVLSELESELAAGKSDKLIAYLKFIGGFYRYSFGNLILILTQKPEATFVAGFHRWIKMDRFVIKGEKGIRIMAPLVRKEKDESSGEEKLSVFGYKAVTVFDISQTDGKEIPNLGGYSGDAEDYLQPLTDFARNLGIQVLWEKPPGGALGVSKGGTILISPDLQTADKFSTLVHELAHELLHRDERRKMTTKTIRETEAEAVAFAVASAVGIESSGFSSDYILFHKGDLEKLKESLDVIRMAASKILDCLLLAVPKEQLV